MTYRPGSERVKEKGAASVKPALNLCIAQGFFNEISGPVWRIISWVLDTGEKR